MLIICVCETLRHQLCQSALYPFQTPQHECWFSVDFPCTVTVFVPKESVTLMGLQIAEAC